MFRKLLLKALKNLKPEEKKLFREILEDKEDVVEEKISETMENKGESEEMPNEKELEEKVETAQPTENGEEKVEETVEKVEETEKEPEEKGEEINKDEEKVEEVEQTEQPTVQNEVDNTPNAIRVEDLITKDELNEKLQALSAKLDAVLKENEDLKNKYERNDFGNFQKKGVADPDKHCNSSFEEYSKQFM